MVKDDLSLARGAVRSLLSRHGENDARIDRVCRSGGGLSRTGVLVSILGAQSIPEHVVALVPRALREANAHKVWEREASVLGALARCCRGILRLYPGYFVCACVRVNPAPVLWDPAPMLCACACTRATCLRLNTQLSTRSLE